LASTHNSEGRGKYEANVDVDHGSPSHGGYDGGHACLGGEAHTFKEECVETLVAIQHGEKLTGQQNQLVRELPTFQACIQASSG
jgi:hypothetical protein